ncbi:toxin-antitoxin system YwqK family antitoxin [Marinoscillum furvescens]|uniref:MORN repeat protein n=1 Tax=Marinoscillum furvescens DSM 4134 TaxID=1122208 RepID=A0A3D9L6Z3_MARFU|nr:hypothetical protein [Marinoscillum furvescens]REE00103.1 MORN repeat protein [Marinoscillum furvescens DSM 4134]
MKRIIALILLVVVGYACSTETQSESAVGEQQLEKVPEVAVVTPYEDGSGVARAEVWDGESLRSVGESIDGLRHGAWMEFTPDGKPSALVTYHRGVQQGVVLDFDKQGYLKNKKFYVQGEFDGPYLVYKRNKLMESRLYSAGELNGTVRKYYDNGRLKEEAPYDQGNLHGVAKWFDQEGNLKLAYEYDQGELVDKEAEVD